VPAADHATNKPGSDTLRDTWVWLVLCAALILGGPGFYLYKRAQMPKAHRPDPPPPPTPAT
jgi:hypothetical protein